MSEEKEKTNLEEEEENASSYDEDEEDGPDPDETEMSEAELGKRRRKAITGRGITLAMLMEDKVIEPGEETMTVEYMGQKFIADLLTDGRIKMKEDNSPIFNSPSAWAIHCKKIVNPAKKSGCGWASVRYKGKKLDAFKSTWFRKQQPKPVIQQPTYLTNGSQDKKDKESDSKDENDEGGAFKKPRLDSSQSADDSTNIKTEGSPPKVVCLEHSSLGRRSSSHDSNTLVRCTRFSALGKMQPFTISVATNCLLLMDFHCHLTTSEVAGYIAGKWDPNTQHLSVEQAFPCKCRIGSVESAAMVEEEIRNSIERRSLQLVGWYHSHPKSVPNPSLKDIDSQMEYQLKLKGAGHTYHPCLGMIVTPYSTKQKEKESRVKAFWVMPPPEQRPLDYGMPMAMDYNITQDIYLSQDALTHMKWLTDFYRGEPDMINFYDTWHQTTTFLDKLKASLGKNFPKDQTDGRFIEYIHNILMST